MKNFKLLLGYLKKAYAYSPMKFVGQAIVFLSISLLGAFYEPLVLQQLFDIMPQRNLSKLLTAGSIALVVLIITFAIGYLNNIYVDLHSFKTSNFIGREGLKQLRSISPTIKYKYDKGGIFERISSLGMGVELLWNQVLIITYVLLSLLISYKLAGATAIAFISILLVGYGIDFLKTTFEIKTKIKLEESLKNANSEIFETSNNFIANFDFYLTNGVNEMATSELIALENKKYAVVKKQELLTAFSDCLTQVISIIQTVVLSFVLLTQYISGLISFGTIFLFYTLFTKMNILFKGLLRALKGISITVVPIKRYDEMVNFQSKVLDSRTFDKATPLITIKNASIIKDGRAILNDVSLDINSGEKIALVGHNGSGKSTLIRLILGVEPLDKGVCKLHNKDTITLDDINKAEIAYIPALPLLFGETVEKNIQMSTKEDVINTSICDDILSSLPENISGGQCQRANIARGINKNPILLLADEPTANLDPEKAKEMIDKITSLSACCIVAVHDTSLLSRFDRVIHMENGRIIN